MSKPTQLIKVKIIWDKVPKGVVFTSEDVSEHEDRIACFLRVYKVTDVVHSKFKITKTDMITVIYYKE